MTKYAILHAMLGNLYRDWLAAGEINALCRVEQLKAGDDATKITLLMQRQAALMDILYKHLDLTIKLHNLNSEPLRASLADLQNLMLGLTMGTHGEEHVSALFNAANHPDNFPRWLEQTLLGFEE